MPAIIGAWVVGDWAVRVWQEAGEQGYVHFVVAEIVGGTLETGPQMRRKGEPPSEHCETTGDIKQAAEAIHGMVRFDGAIHTNWPLDGDGYLCGDRLTLVTLADVFTYIADEAKRLFLRNGVHAIGL